ncbi:MAG: TetR/AcrR family transcriptional regulator [Pseudomonadota bacterium]|nr:TetR/AcrR family transcriptional regulator [Pseudomonadota bacterium]
MGSKGDRNREQTLQTAGALIYQRGYGQTSFADIARSSGIPKGNFYYYYKVKDDILRDVLARLLENVRRDLSQWEASEPTPKARLKRFVRMVRNNAEDLSRYGCPMGSIATEIGKDNGDLKQHTRAMFDLYRDWLAVQFARAFPEPLARDHARHLLVADLTYRVTASLAAPLAVPARAIMALALVVSIRVVDRTVMPFMVGHP